MWEAPKPLLGPQCCGDLKRGAYVQCFVALLGPTPDCARWTPTQLSCDLADNSPNLEQANSLDDWHKMLLLLVYQIFVHTKIIANLLFRTSCVKHFKKVWSPERSGNKTEH